MKRWITFAARFYPRSWREEYGKEFDALLDDVKPRGRVFANVLGGAISMQITKGTNWLKLAVAMAAAGAIVAMGASFAVPSRYVSSAAISVTPQPDPLRPVSPEALRQRAAANFAAMEGEILSRTSLADIVVTLNLYEKDRQRMPLEDVLERMRQDIRIQAHPSTDNSSAPMVFSISFDYRDRVKAQTAVRQLAAKFTQANEMANRNQANMYLNFWKDEATEAAFHHEKMAPAPPPPVGDTIAVLDAASLPKEPLDRNRLVFLAWGLGAGLVLGLLAALAMRSPRGVRRLAGFAGAGCALAAAASFLIPDRYTSTAVLQITPVQVTEDPLTAPRAATPAAEFLREWAPQVVSVQNLSAIIQDPRINLYSKERARKPIEDVAREMLARDLRVTPVNPASGATATPAAFSISFSYPDRTKAHDLVQMLIVAFQEQHLTADRNNDVLKKSAKLHEITQRKAGENLDVLDPPSLPVTPVTPNRLLITAIGLGIGLLVGALTLIPRRHPTPAMQPA